jgi:hypothetical protein
LAAERPINKITLGTADVQLRDVDIGHGVRVDEVRLEGASVEIGLGGPENVELHANDLRVRAVLSEQSLNRAIEANMPMELPFRGIRVAILSGRLRVEGRFVKFVSIPVAIEGRPEIENGNRIVLAWQDVRGAGFSFPGAMREWLASYRNLAIDLSRLPIPVWVDSVACEPGRLTLVGRARIHIPPQPVPSLRPFGALPAEERDPDRRLEPGAR